MPNPLLRPRAVALAAASLLTLSAQAQSPTPSQALPTGDTVVAPVQSIVIKGQTLQGTAQTYSSTVLDPQQIRDQAIVQPEELLRLVPGVVVRALSLGGVVNTVTIRGFSSGAHGGDLGMVVDGVPLNEAMSHADGYADLNVVVPLEIERFQVFRGPVSALYGNFNRGGVIAIETRHGGEYATFDASAGSFGTVDVQGVFGAKLGPGRFNGALQAYKTDGYRPGFDYSRSTLAARYSLDLGHATQVSLSLRGHRGDWDSAGNVTRAQFEGSNPYGRDPRVVADGGLKRYTSGRIDVNRALSDSIKLLTFLYGNQQDYTRFFTRPIDATAWSQREETYDRDVAGGGFSLNGRSAALGPNVNWVAGVELYRESTYFINFEGTVARQRVNVPIYDRTYKLDSLGTFGEAEIVFSPLLRASLGLRWDRFTGGCSRNGTENGTGPDGCERLNTAQRATPKFGLRSTVRPGLDLRASVAEGFALPPGAVKYSPGGANVAPTVFRQLELGVNGSMGRLLKADLAVYRIDSRNEVRTVAVGQFENFGQTRRDGVEASLTLMPVTHLEVGLVGAFMEAKVKQNTNPALVGLLVTGVPKESGTLSIAWRPPEGLSASVEVRKAGSFAVLANNTAFHGGYTTVDAGLQYSGAWSAGQRYRAYLKLENATDRLYATSTGITSGQQTYNVAPPRGVRLGLQADF